MKKIFFYLALICTAALSQPAVAQQNNQPGNQPPKMMMPPTYPPDQIAAMKKIDWLVGKWRGTGWALAYGGKRETFTIDESIEYRLGGLVAVVEGLGKSKDAATGEEKTTHHAFAVLSYDPQAKVYRWRAHTFYGNALDLTAEITDKTFVWGFKHPQAGDTRYTITLSDKGNWLETGEMSRDGGKTWMKFLEMELQKIK